MIRFFIMNGKNSTRFDMPTDELFDHLGSIGIREDIPITCSEKIYLDFYPTDDKDEIADIVCKRLLATDKISDVNALCRKLDGLCWINTRRRWKCSRQHLAHKSQSRLISWRTMKIRMQKKFYRESIHPKHAR